MERDLCLFISIEGVILKHGAFTTEKKNLYISKTSLLKEKPKEVILFTSMKKQFKEEILNILTRKSFLFNRIIFEMPLGKKFLFAPNGFAVNLERNIGLGNNKFIINSIKSDIDIEKMKKRYLLDEYVESDGNSYFICLDNLIQNESEFLKFVDIVNKYVKPNDALILILNEKEYDITNKIGIYKIFEKTPQIILTKSFNKYVLVSDFSQNNSLSSFAFDTNYVEAEASLSTIDKFLNIVSKNLVKIPVLM